MKKLHSILALLLIMVCSMNFAACSSDDDDEASSSIIGKWAYEDDPDAGFIFSKDGEMIFWEDDQEDLEAYYRISGNKLICEYEEDGEACRDEFTIVKLNSTTLILGGYDEDEYEEWEMIRVQ